MAGIKIKSFDQLDPIEENDGRLILNYDGKTGKSTKKLSELINSTNILVTARWKPEWNRYVPDRELSELLASIDRGVVPVLRVVNGDDKTFYNMASYTSDSITFKAPVVYGIEGGTKMLIPEFLYTTTAFTDMSTEQPITGVDIDLIDIG